MDRSLTNFTITDLHIKILNLYDEGVLASKVAKIIGSSPQNVSKITKKLLAYKHVEVVNHTD